MATGENEEKTIGSGPNAGRLYDYYVWAQQQTAAFEYTSAGLCGIGYGHLFDSSLANTTLTFACNDGFFFENVAEFDRSAILVDGANAYLSFNAHGNKPRSDEPARDLLHGQPGPGERRHDDSGVRRDQLLLDRHLPA